MRRLIISFSSTGIGALAQSKTGEARFLIYQDPLFCPIAPESDGLDFYLNQKAFMQKLSFDGCLTLLDDADLQPVRKINNYLPDIDKIELWVDAAYYSYVGAFQFLDMVKFLPDIKSRLWINWLDTSLGLMNQKQIISVEDKALAVPHALYDEATTLWQAYRHHTPEKWFDLRHHISSHFKHYHSFNRWMLRQLPHHKTGLRQISHEILKRVNGDKKTVHIVVELLTDTRLPPHILGDYNYFRAINQLSNAHTPAITNIKLPGYDYWDSNIQRGEEWQQYCQSRPSLTPFGKRLLSGASNWREHNKTDLWWGGTHITDENYWSYDPDKDMISKQS